MRYKWLHLRTIPEGTRMKKINQPNSFSWPLSDRICPCGLRSSTHPGRLFWSLWEDLTRRELPYQCPRWPAWLICRWGSWSLRVSSVLGCPHYWITDISLHRAPWGWPQCEPLIKTFMPGAENTVKVDVRESRREAQIWQGLRTESRACGCKWHLTKRCHVA